MAGAIPARPSPESEALMRSILTHDEKAKPTPMRDLVKLRPPDVTVRADETYQFAGVYCFGRGVFKGARKSGMEFAYPRLTQLRAGELVNPKRQRDKQHQISGRRNKGCAKEQRDIPIA